MGVDRGLVSATRERLARRPTGATRVGWKFGSGQEEQLGGDHVVGHITSATTLDPGAVYFGGGDDLHADVEVAVEIGEDLEPARYAVALEICDLASVGSLEEELIAVNDYHRAVTSASSRSTSRRMRSERVLAAVGESLQPGDRVITGLIVNTPLRSGDVVHAELGSLGCIGLLIR